MDTAKLVIGIIFAVSIILLIAWGGISTTIAISLNNQLVLVQNEKNQISQDYDKMKQELTGKNEIMEKQKVLLEKLKGAKTLKDYLVIWREAEK